MPNLGSSNLTNQRNVTITKYAASRIQLIQHIVWEGKVAFSMPTVENHIYQYPKTTTVIDSALITARRGRGSGKWLTIEVEETDVNLAWTDSNKRRNTCLVSFKSDKAAMKWAKVVASRLEVPAANFTDIT